MVKEVIVGAHLLNRTFNENEESENEEEAENIHKFLTNVESKRKHVKSKN